MGKRFFLSCFLLFFGTQTIASNHKLELGDTLKGGWYPWDPYQYEDKYKKLIGLDVELTQRLLAKIGRKLETNPISWKDHQKGLKEGTVDIAAGATFTEARAKLMHYSKPYRYEVNSFFVAKKDQKFFPKVTSIPQFLSFIKKKSVKIAVIDGFVYADKKINSFIADPKNKKLIFKTKNDFESLSLLKSKKVKGFLADRVVGSTVVWKNKLGDSVSEIPLHIKTPIHFMLSKKTVPLSFVKELNEAIEMSRRLGENEDLFISYMGPTMLKGGWYPWSPYQYEVVNDGYKNLLGLDVELTQRILAKISRTVDIKAIPWKDHQKGLKEGTVDIAAGATFTKARAVHMHYSKPYRFEVNSLFVARDNQEFFPKVKSISQFLDFIKKKSVKLAVIDGFIYADKKINDFIEDPQNKDLIMTTKDDFESVTLLQNKEVQGFLADRVVGSSVIWKNKLGNKIVEVPLNIKTPIHFMLSKKSVPINILNELNEAIEASRKSGENKDIFTSYMAPVLLLKTIESPWFKIVDLIGTIAFALSGLIIALEKKSTLLAGILFALLPSFGGGVVRDVMFGIAPVQVLRTAYYFITILSVVLGGYLVTFLGTKKISNFFNRMIPKKIKDSHVGDDNPYLVITDAMGLAAFTISGVFVTLLAKIEPLWLWGPLFSLMTGVLGGVIRDIIAHRKISALNGDLYPEWCILGGFFLAFYIDWYSLDMTQELMTRGILMTLLGVFFLRIISYIFNIKSPIFK